MLSYARFLRICCRTLPSREATTEEVPLWEVATGRRFSDWVPVKTEAWKLGDMLQGLPFTAEEI